MERGLLPMTTWIGIEYLVGQSFIQLIEHSNQRFIKIEKIFHYQKTLMDHWKKENEDIDALIFGSLSKISTEFKDWFSVFSNAGLIVLNDNVDEEMLKQRFFIDSVEIQESFKKNASALF